jgi:hypothetical protein
MTTFESYFLESLCWSFFIKLIFFPPNMDVKELAKWVAFHKDVIN